MKQTALSKRKELERALCVECPYCFAKVAEHCVSDGYVNTRSRSPHADRVARSNGLKATPRSGMYARPSDGMQWTDAERAAFKAAGLELPS